MPIDVLTYAGAYPVRGTYDLDRTLDETATAPTHELIGVGRVRPLQGESTIAGRWRDLYAGSLISGRYIVVGTPLTALPNLSVGETIRIADPRGVVTTAAPVTVGEVADTFHFAGLTLGGPFLLSSPNLDLEIIKRDTAVFDVVSTGTGQVVVEVSGDVNLAADLPLTGIIRTYVNVTGASVNLVASPGAFFDAASSKPLAAGGTMGVVRAANGTLLIAYKFDN